MQRYRQLLFMAKGLDQVQEVCRSIFHGFKLGSRTLTGIFKR